MDSMTAKLLGARITLLRQTHGMSMGDLAKSAELAKSYLSKLERGEAPNPGLRTLSTIAFALQVTVRDLLPGDRQLGPQQLGEIAERGVQFETIAGSMPKALQEFIADQAAKGDPVPDDTIQALAVLKMRGKRPEGIDDYRLLYAMIQRVVS